MTSYMVAAGGRWPQATIWHASQFSLAISLYSGDSLSLHYKMWKVLSLAIPCRSSTPQLFAKHLFGDTRCVFISFSACPKLLNTFLTLICGQPAKFTDCMHALRDVVHNLFISLPRLATDNLHEHEGSMMSKTLAWLLECHQLLFNDLMRAFSTKSYVH